MNNHHVLTAKAPQHFCHGLTQLAIKYSNDLTFDICGVSHRAEHIKNGSQAQLFARTYGIAHSAVMGWRKHKADTDLFHTTRYLFRCDVELDPCCFKNICASGRTGYTAIAMFCHAATGSGHHDSAGGGYVK